MSEDTTGESVAAVPGCADVHWLVDLLKARADTGDGPVLPPPTHEWLDVDGVTDDLVASFIDLLHTYPRFAPPLTPERVREESLEALLLHGSHRSGFQQALLASISPMPEYETTELLRRLRNRGIEGDQEKQAAQWLVSSLLDNSATRDATVGALEWMVGREDLDPIVEYVRPQLEPDEIARLDDSV